MCARARAEASAFSSPDRFRKIHRYTEQRSGDDGASKIVRFLASLAYECSDFPRRKQNFRIFKTTVDIERPREGGASINCSQIASRHCPLRRFRWEKREYRGRIRRLVKRRK